MMAGDIDAFPVFPAPETSPSSRPIRASPWSIGTTEGETILAMNNGKKPFNDLKVRQAMSYAIDRKAIIDGAMFGYGTPIGSHFSPADPGYVDLTGMYPYDPDKAQGAAQGSRLSGRLQGDAQAAAAGLCPPRRRDHRRSSSRRSASMPRSSTSNGRSGWPRSSSSKDYDLTIVSHTEPADINIYARDDYYFDYHSDAFKKIMADLNLDHRSGQAHSRFSATRSARSPRTRSTSSCSSSPRPACGTPRSRACGPIPRSRPTT